MKKQVRNDRKLVLNTETVRSLQTTELIKVAAGQVTTTVLESQKTLC